MVQVLGEGSLLLLFSVFPIPSLSNLWSFSSSESRSLDSRYRLMIVNPLEGNLQLDSLEKAQ